METTTLELVKSATAVFGANGVATAVLGNGGLSRWVIKVTSVSTTSVVATKCVTYRGAAVPSNQIDSTKLGNGTSSDTVIPLASGGQLTVQWSNGTPGAIATVKIEGDDIVNGRRMY